MLNNLQNKLVPKVLAQTKGTYVLSSRLQIHRILEWVQQYWFRGVIIGFLAFLLLKKDVSFQISLKNGFTPSTSMAANVSPHDSHSPKAKTAAWSNTVGVLDVKRKQQDQYVARFARVAKAEMEKYGIPASITLAQGLLESNAGKSRLAANNNNHFGIKCFSKKCKKGHCSNFSDDSHKDFFRKYETAWESYRAHSLLLQKERYQSLYRLDKRDYKAWAQGLRKAGYATDKRYAKKLIHIIEDLRLYEYDAM